VRSAGKGLDQLRDKRCQAGGNRDDDPNSQAGFSKTTLGPMGDIERKSARIARGDVPAYPPALWTLLSHKFTPSGG